MKKILSLILVLVLCFGLCACNAATSSTPDSTAAPETYYKIGDTVSTNLFKFTLDTATLAIALENTHGENFGVPKEYDPQEDNQNPFVAPTGHTFAAFTYTVENISRSSEYFHRDDFVDVIYKGIEYASSMDDVAIMYYQQHLYYYNNQPYINEPNTWYTYDVSGILADAGAKQSLKAYADFDVEADSLKDGFCLRVSIPSSNGTEVFTYQIPASN